MKMATTFEIRSLCKDVKIMMVVHLSKIEEAGKKW
jgi:hypothetical protein